jgi:hypothetical protein
VAVDYTRIVAFALQRLNEVRTAFAADSQRVAAEAQAILDLGKSDEVQAAIAQNETAKERLVAVLAEAKQTLDNLPAARAARERGWTEIEKTLQQLATWQK